MNERLTRRNTEEKAFFKPLTPDCGNCDNCEDKGIHREMAAEKLAAYEDTGLTPAEVLELAQAALDRMEGQE